MDSFFPFFFLLLLSKEIRIGFREYTFFYTRWIKSFQTLFKHASLIFIVSRVPRHEKITRYILDPLLVKLTRAYHTAVSRTSILVFRIIETCCWRIFTFQCQSSSRQRRGSSWTARYSTSGWTPLSTGALPPNCKITFKNR